MKKEENAGYQHFSFSHNVFKSLFYRVVKSSDCMVKSEHQVFSIKLRELILLTQVTFNLSIFILHRLTNKFLQLILISFDSGYILPMYQCKYYFVVQNEVKHDKAKDACTLRGIGWRANGVVARQCDPYNLATMPFNKNWNNKFIWIDKGNSSCYFTHEMQRPIKSLLNYHVSVKYLNPNFQNETRVPNMDFQNKVRVPNIDIGRWSVTIVSLVFNANNRCYKLFQDLNTK